MDKKKKKSNLDIFDSDNEEEEEEEQEENNSEEKKSEDSKNDSNKNDQENEESENDTPEIIDVNESEEENPPQIKTIPQKKNNLYGIFILGLPYETTESELLKLFTPFGEIMKINLPKYQNTSRNVGYCYIYYNNENSAMRSLQLNRHKIGKRYLEITLVKNNNHCKDNCNIDPDDVPLDCTTAFVKNLSYDTTIKEVEDKFKNCGDINEVRFVNDCQTNKFKGFCYIDFREHKGLLRALKLNNTFFGGRKIHVDYEQGKPKKSHKAEEILTFEQFKMLKQKRNSG